jgi:hypothetical protein
MAAFYGGEGETLVYSDTAEFDLTTGSEQTEIFLAFESGPSVGFDSLEFDVTANGAAFDRHFDTIAAADAFFTNGALILGIFGSGAQTVDLSFTFTACDPGEAYGFDYTLGAFPIAPAPEASTWVMSVQGFASLGIAGYRRRGNTSQRHTA